jgi:hypothetical protein
MMQSWIVPTRHFWHDDTAPDIRLVQDVLNLTPPGQYVMDGKCESIFRPRPFYYVIETMTDARLKRGMLEDDIPKRLAETRTPVARLERLPWAAHRFVHANYVHVTPRLLVLGKTICDTAPSSRLHRNDSEIQFQIEIPARYTLFGTNGPVDAMLDGRAVQGPTFLQAGVHRLSTSIPAERLMLVWSDAIEHGYKPQWDAETGAEHQERTHLPHPTGRKWKRHHGGTPTNRRPLSTT